MIVRENVSLQSLTSFRSGGEARVVVECATVADVIEAIRLAKERTLPFYVLGEGSNVLAHDDGYNGVVIVNKILGMEFTETGDSVVARIGAGEAWDTFVSEVGKRALWGVENLAGIPGTVGAAPVQNIGAYGAELKDTFLSVEVLDTTTEEVKTLHANECAFGYRDSRFKHESNLIILQVSFILSKQAKPKLAYGDLLRAQEEGVDLSTPEAIGAVVRAIRNKKFPDRTQYGTAGSFFKNPIITPEQYEALTQMYGPIPQFPNPNGIKIPLAFILDTVLHLRGYRKETAWLFGAQPLVLVLDGGGNSRAVELLAQEIESKVFESTGIKIEREVRSLQ